MGNDQDLYGKDSMLRWAASQREDAPKESIKTMQRLGSTWDLMEYKEEKVEPGISAETLAGLIPLGYWPRYLISRYPETPAELLAEMVSYEEVSMLEAIALHPNSSIKTLERLANHAQFEVCAAVAQNPNTPEPTLRMLESTAATRRWGPDLWRQSNHRSAVRSKVASNPSTPRDLLLALSKDGDTLVRAELASNPSLPPEGFLPLAKDTQRSTRMALAGNPSITLEASRLLAEDEYVETKVALANNPQTPREVLFLLASDKEARVKRSVVQHANLPVEALQLFEKEKNRELREAARSHPNNPVLLGLLRSLFEAAQESNELHSDLPERALLTLEAIAPQGFDPAKTGPLLSSLCEALEAEAKKNKNVTELLCGAFAQVAAGWSKDSTLEHRVALDSLRAAAIKVLCALGEKKPKATEKIDALLGEEPPPTKEKKSKATPKKGKKR